MCPVADTAAATTTTSVGTWSHPAVFLFYTPRRRNSPHYGDGLSATCGAIAEWWRNVHTEL